MSSTVHAQSVTLEAGTCYGNFANVDNFHAAIRENTGLDLGFTFAFDDDGFQILKFRKTFTKDIFSRTEGGIPLDNVDVSFSIKLPHTRKAKSVWGYYFDAGLKRNPSIVANSFLNIGAHVGLYIEADEPNSSGKKRLLYFKIPIVGVFESILIANNPELKQVPIHIRRANRANGIDLGIENLGTISWNTNANKRTTVVANINLNFYNLDFKENSSNDEPFPSFYGEVSNIGYDVNDLYKVDNSARNFISHAAINLTANTQKSFSTKKNVKFQPYLNLGFSYGELNLIRNDVPSSSLNPSPAEIKAKNFFPYVSAGFKVCLSRN